MMIFKIILCNLNLNMHPILINYNSFVDHMFNCIFFDPCKQISRLVIIP